MRNVKRLLFMAFAVLLSFTAALPTAAAQITYENKSHVTDYTDTLTMDEIENFDKNCNELFFDYRIDASAVVVTSKDYDSSSLSEIGDYVYQRNNFGYGDTKDGIMIAYDMESGQVCVNTYGAASHIMTDAYVEMLEEIALGYENQYGAWGVIVSPVLAVRNDLAVLVEKGEYVLGPISDSHETSSYSTTYPDSSTNSNESYYNEATASKEGHIVTPISGERPYWYPEPGSKFVPFHNESAPRVVDDADIFTAEEEDVMLNMIRSIQERHMKDIVIYTSDKGYGMEKEDLASCFFDYGGYGLGDNFEGMCLLLLMDPNERGYRTSAYGKETEALYSQENSEYMDDCLYNFVRDKEDESGNKIPGEYGTGVINWISNADSLFTYGYASSPSWYIGDATGKERFHDVNAPRVTFNNSFLITDEELQELTEQCKVVSDKMGMDIAIHFTNSLSRMEKEEYARLFYNSQGYGFGDNYEGMLLVLVNNQTNSTYKTCTYISGEKPESLTEVNFKRLDSHVTTKNSGSKSPYKAARVWLNDLEHMADTGRVMPHPAYWVFVVILSLIISLVASIVIIIKEDDKKKTPKVRKTALQYAIPQTLSVILTSEKFVKMNQKLIHSPVTTSSKSSSSTSSSSSSSNNYNSSYQSSSGRSHTTSGRDF